MNGWLGELRGAVVIDWVVELFTVRTAMVIGMHFAL